MAYFDPIPLRVVDGDTAKAADLNSMGTSLETSFGSVQTDITNVNTSAEAWAGVSQEWAEAAEDIEVEVGKYSSLHHSAKSLGHADDSDTARAASVVAQGLSETAKGASEVAQGLSEDARDTSLIHSNTSLSHANDSNTARELSVVAQGLSEDARDASASSQSAAASSASSASSSADSSLASENKSFLWAEELEDVEVEVGKYSALHWAAKSAAVVASVIKSVNILYITSDTTYTKPSNLVLAEVTVVGGGGGGTSIASIGAGAGGWCKKTYLNTSLGASTSITIGQGGVFGTDSGINNYTGDNGTPTYFYESGGTLLATGGRGAGTSTAVNRGYGLGGLGSGGDSFGRGASGTTRSTSSVDHFPPGAPSIIDGGGIAYDSITDSVSSGKYGSGCGSTGSGDPAVSSLKGGDGVVIIKEYLS